MIFFYWTLNTFVTNYYFDISYYVFRVPYKKCVKLKRFVIYEMKPQLTDYCVYTQ